MVNRLKSGNYHYNDNVNNPSIRKQYILIFEIRMKKMGIKETAIKLAVKKGVKYNAAGQQVK